MELEKNTPPTVPMDIYGVFEDKHEITVMMERIMIGLNKYPNFIFHVTMTDARKL